MTSGSAGAAVCRVLVLMALAAWSIPFAMYYYGGGLLVWKDGVIINVAQTTEMIKASGCGGSISSSSSGGGDENSMNTSSVATTTPTTSSSGNSIDHDDHEEEEEDVPDEEKIPSLIIAGAQKGGTTALAAILAGDWDSFRMNSYWWEGGTHSEPHFFDDSIFGEGRPEGLSDAEFAQISKSRRGGRYYGVEGMWRQRAKDVSDEEWRLIRDKRDADWMTSLDGALSKPHVLDAIRRKYREHWYRKDIPEEKRDSTVYYEKTPAYMCEPQARHMILKTAPWAKIIIVLREPVSRVFSGYRMNLGRGDTTMGFERQVELNMQMLRREGLTTAPTFQQFVNGTFDNATAFDLPAYYKDNKMQMRKDIQRLPCFPMQRSMYAGMLQWYMEHYELGKNLLVVTSEKLQENAPDTVREIYNFMGLPPKDLPESLLKENHNPSKSTIAMDPKMLEYLKRLYKPYQSELRDVMGQAWYDANIGNRWDISTSQTETS